MLVICKCTLGFFFVLHLFLDISVLVALAF
jgi:hypothetical protein